MRRAAALGVLGLGALALSVLALSVLALTGCATDDTPPEERAVIQRLLDFRQAVADHDAEAACDVFSTRLVLRWPDTPDRGKAEHCAFLADRLADPELTIGYDPPHVESISVDGDRASVDVRWVGTATSPDGTERWAERGSDELEREADGVWRIVSSDAAPAPVPSP